MNVALGMILEESTTRRLYRLVHKDVTRVSLMPIGEKDAWNIFVGAKAFAMNLEDGTWKEYFPPVSTSTEDDTVRLHQGSAVSQDHGDALYKLLAEAFSYTPQLLTSKGRGALWNDLRAAEKSLAKSTFYKAVRRWLEGGLVPIALRARWGAGRTAMDKQDLETIDLAAAIETVRSESMRLQRESHRPGSDADSTKLGRHRKRNATKSPTLYRVDRQTLRVFKTYFDRKQKQMGKTLPALYNEMRGEVFATVQPFGPPEKWPTWAIPSFAQFSYYWREMVGYKQKRVAAHGAKTFETSERAKLGQSISLAYAAGRIGELDATVWNVELVGEGPDAPIIGSPVVFRIRCKDTGQLLGLSISLEDASFAGAALAIANCLEDKAAFCQRIGINDMVVPWNVRGLPAQIDADMGETYNNKPKRFVRLTGVSIETMPGGRGDMKPGVESDWHTLQTRLSPLTPGAIIKAYEAEHGIKWRMRAAMTLKQFTRELVLEELKRMHTPRGDMKLPADLVARGVTTAPHDMFEWSVRNSGGGLKKVDETLVRLSLLDLETGSVTERGLTVKGVHYVCKSLRLAEAHARARQMGRRTVRVAKDPLLVDRVWLIEGDEEAPTSYEPCRMDMNFINQRSYAGKTWREVLSTIREGTTLDIVATENRLQQMDALSRLQAENRSTARERVAQARKDFETNESQLTLAREDARLEEKNALSPGLAITAPLAPKQDAPAATVTPITRVAAPPQPPKMSRFERLAQRHQPNVDDAAPARLAND
ncbi:hypothetical protein [Rhizobacter fulvus]